MNKPTKNQATAVRDYLSSIGHRISHVQALEVIARGMGYRSRHAVGKAEPTAVAAQPETDVGVCLCKKCDTPLEGKYCGDKTCPYSEWPQAVSEEDLYTHSTEELEKKYGVKCNDPESLADDIRWDYYMSRRQRSDLEGAHKKLLLSCSELFLSEESAMAFLMEEAHPAETEGAYDETARAAEIKAEYDSSRCHADDVDHAVNRLLTECPSLYSDGRKAWSYVNEELREKLEGEDFIVQVESDLFGNEVFTYYTEEERRAGIVRLMAKAVELNDGVTRRYYFSEIDSDLEKDTLEYDQALRMRGLEGEIVDSVVFYKGDRIGTIVGLTEGGLTLYSWIDENP